MTSARACLRPGGLDDSPGAAAEVDGEHARPPRRGGCRCRRGRRRRRSRLPGGRAPRRSGRRTPGRAWRRPSRRRWRRGRRPRPGRRASDSAPAGWLPANPTRRPAAAQSRQRGRGVGIDVVELLVARDARGLALGEGAAQVEARPAELQCVAVRVAALDGRADAPRTAPGGSTPIQSAHTPHARSSLSSVSPKSKTAARSLTARAAPAARRRCARPPRRSSATARRRRSRTCPAP